MSDPVPVSRPLEPDVDDRSVDAHQGLRHDPKNPGIPQRNSWFQRLSSVLFIIFCFELGLFLLIYPWISAWSDNYFAWAVPQHLQKTWNIVWNNAYVRGAVSGLGIANVWIALVEIFRLFKRH